MRVFISYKREDIDRVAILVDRLRREGIETWWDQDIPPGGSWRETIAEQLDSSDLCVVAWSDTSTGEAGRYVREEAERAAARGAYLGVLIDPVTPPFGFAEWQAVDLAAWNGRAKDPLLDHFVEKVRARLEGRPADPASAPRLRSRRRRRAIWPMAAAGTGLLGAAALAGFLWWSSGAEAQTPTAFVNARTSDAPCSWVQISSVADSGGEGERIALAGIAAAPEALQAAVMREAAAASVPVAELDVADVATAPPETCAELELLRGYRFDGRSRLAIVPPRGALERTEHGWTGRFEWELDFAALPPRAALLGLDSVGGLEMLVPDLHAFRREAEPLRSDGSIATYEGYFFDENQGARNVGLILMTADRDIDAELVGAVGRRSDRDFLTRLDEAARAAGWRFELGLVHCGFEADAQRRC